MKINLTQREIEYILFLINKSAENSTDGSIESFGGYYTDDDIELMDKLEQALRLIEIEKFGLVGTLKNKYLN